MRMKNETDAPPLRALVAALESWAPPVLQEAYDNSGLLVGEPDTRVTGVLVSLDLTEAVIDEAIARGCNVVVSHHPIIFGKLQRLTGADYVQRSVMKALRAGVALFAIHTNLDNVKHGVNATIAQKIGLVETEVLLPKAGMLHKLVTFVPHAQADAVRDALFAAGAGAIGQYHKASFNSVGTGTFEAQAGASPFVGTIGQLQQEPETRIEVVLESWKRAAVMAALLQAHPYETVAYNLIALENSQADIGAGQIGRLPTPMDEMDFLQLLKKQFGGGLRYTQLLGRPVQTVAVCGGSGSFLLNQAKRAGADVFVTADFKYHQFFDAENCILIADLGHYESEQFTKELITRYLSEKFTTFAVLNSETNTNPINYL